MNVLLATDGSPQATVTLETAVALLRKERVKFDLLFGGRESPEVARLTSTTDIEEALDDSRKAKMREPGMQLSRAQRG